MTLRSPSPCDLRSSPNRPLGRWRPRSLTPAQSEFLAWVQTLQPAPSQDTSLPDTRASSSTPATAAHARFRLFWGSRCPPPSPPLPSPHPSSRRPRAFCLAAREDCPSAAPDSRSPQRCPQESRAESSQSADSGDLRACCPTRVPEPGARLPCGTSAVTPAGTGRQADRSFLHRRAR